MTAAEEPLAFETVEVPIEQVADRQHYVSRQVDAVGAQYLEQRAHEALLRFVRESGLGLVPGTLSAEWVLEVRATAISREKVTEATGQDSEEVFEQVLDRARQVESFGRIDVHRLINMLDNPEEG